MNKYRKKPVVIEATQFLATKQSWDNVMALGNIKWRPGSMGSGFFVIETLEGEHVVTKGDWIIKGVKGEFYPCKPDIFELTYDKE